MRSRWIDLAGQKRADRAMLGDSGFERVEGDFYATEAWVTQALLDAVEFRGVIWESACGRGDMSVVLRGAGYSVMDSDIAGSSLGCAGAIKLDFLDDPLLRGERVALGSGTFSIVTNPPYTLAERFLRRALEFTRQVGGMVAMLFRNEYDCAASRRDLFEHPAFSAKLVLVKRPRWIDSGHTASPRHNFAWYVWDWQNKAIPRIGWIPYAS
jgi:hypothetical protein